MRNQNDMCVTVDEQSQSPLPPQPINNENKIEMGAT